MRDQLWNNSFESRCKDFGDDLEIAKADRAEMAELGSMALLRDQHYKRFIQPFCNFSFSKTLMNKTDHLSSNEIPIMSIKNSREPVQSGSFQRMQGMNAGLNLFFRRNMHKRDVFL